MTSKHNQLKKETEKHIGIRFLEYYNIEQGKDYEIIDQPDPPYPDIICADSKSGEIIRLEITEFWEDNAHAKDNYDLVKGHITEEELFKQKLSSFNNEIETDSDKNRLKQILSNKLDKEYAGEEDIILVIYDRSPFLTQERLINILADIKIINSDPFMSIYFVLLIPFTYGEYKIYRIAAT